MVDSSDFIHWFQFATMIKQVQHGGLTPRTQFWQFCQSKTAKYWVITLTGNRQNVKREIKTIPELYRSWYNLIESNYVNEEYDNVLTRNQRSINIYSHSPQTRYNWVASNKSVATEPLKFINQPEKKNTFNSVRIIYKKGENSEKIGWMVLTITKSQLRCS